MENSEIKMQMEIRELELQLKEADKLKSLLLSQKDVFNIDELATYTGYSKSSIYKLTSKNIIPYYKGLGKFVWFERKEIESWLLTNKQEIKK
jgi:excisionase family DNA binding protein